MSVKVYTAQQFYGGLATDKKLGPRASFADSQAFDFRKSPTTLSVLPRLAREDAGIVKDLILKEVMIADGTIYAYGNAGYVYRRSVNGVWSEVGKLSTGYGGLDYRADSNALYLTSSKTASLYNLINTAPTLFPDYYGQSFSTYNNSDNMGFNVNAYQIGSILTTNIPTSIIETQPNLRYFQTDIEPLSKISVFITSKGTGNWTLTLHDGLNNVLGVKTLANANVTSGQFNDFVFTAAPNSQVRVYPAPNARTYHVHVTSTVNDGKVSSTTLNDLSTCDLQVWADRFVVTKNGLHPVIRYQQFEAFGNSNYLSIWEPISTIPTNDEWLRHKLTFPQEYEVCGLAVQNEFIVIAAEKNTSVNTSTPQEGILFFWDGTSPTYNYFIEIPEGSPFGLRCYKNVIYYLAGGAWYAVTSAETQPVKLRTMPGSDNEFSGVGQTTNTSTTPVGEQLFEASGTFTVPLGVTSVRVAAIGGGGGGSGRTNSGAPVSGQGAGGGGGSMASSIVSVTPGSAHTVVVGTGGAGSTGNASNGINSTFDTTTVIASRGSGATGGAVATRGLGGTTAASTGNVKFAGGNGGQATGGGSFSGGGGEGSSLLAPGHAGTDTTTGLGGSGGSGGDGGNGVTLGNVGNTGSAPGGGGAGGYSTSALPGSTGYRSGGAGSRGEVRVSYGGAPLASTLIDNFSGTASTPSMDKWVSFGNYNQANGFLSLTTNTAISSNGIRSILDYDLSSSSAQIRLIDAGNQALTSFNVYPVLVQIDSSNQLFWVVTNGTIKAVKNVAGVATVVNSITYASATFQYLRIRENSGTIYWDYSLDGVTWQNFASTTSPFGIQLVQLFVEADNTGVEATTTAAIVDEFNVIVAADYSVGYPDMMTVRRGVLLVGYPSITANPTTNYGVYSWGSVDANYKPSFGYSYVLSTGDKNITSTNNLQIGMVKSFGDLMHVSWRDDLISGTPRYGVDAISNNSIPAPESIYQTLIIDGNYVAKQKSGLFIEAYYDLPAGATIELAYSINRADFVVDTNVYSSTNMWDNQPGYARFYITSDNGGRNYELQGQLTVRCDTSVTSSPEIRMLAIAYDDGSAEVVQ